MDAGAIDADIAYNKKGRVRALCKLCLGFYSASWKFHQEVHRSWSSFIIYFFIFFVFIVWFWVFVGKMAGRFFRLVNRQRLFVQ